MKKNFLLCTGFVLFFSGLSFGVGAAALRPSLTFNHEEEVILESNPKMKKPMFEVPIQVVIISKNLDPHHSDSWNKELVLDTIEFASQVFSKQCSVAIRKVRLQTILLRGAFVFRRHLTDFSIAKRWHDPTHLMAVFFPDVAARYEVPIAYAYPPFYIDFREGISVPAEALNTTWIPYGHFTRRFPLIFAHEIGHLLIDAKSDPTTQKLTDDGDHLESEPNLMSLTKFSEKLLPWQCNRIKAHKLVVRIK